MSKPRIEVPEFKAQLRAGLQSAMDRERHFCRGPAFVLPVGLAGLLVLALVGFIIFPGVPARLNLAFGGPGTGSPSSPAVDRGRWAKTGSRPEAMEEGSGDLPINLDDYMQGEEIVSTNIDRLVVEKWTRQHYPTTQGATPVLEGEIILALRQFQLANGRRVLVYTELDGPRPGIRKISF
ncbi:MAG: hypothetical protein JXQ27_17910 [Acidobacteria bacterium]|nr:hypothetical protein [Acidobacteriota bacterium]